MKNNKVSAKEYFSNNEYLKAIDCLEQLGVGEFVKFAKRSVRREKKDSWFKKAEFCQSLLHRPELFTNIFQLKNADELVYDYFNFASFLPEFEEQLYNEFPHLFINSVKVSLSFLGQKRSAFYSGLVLSKEFVPHQKVWKYLFDLDETIWSKVEENLSGLVDSKLPVEDVLCQLIMFFEEKRFKTNSDLVIYDLANVYDLFISLYFDKIRISHLQTIKSQEGFFKSFHKGLNSPIDKNLRELLNRLCEWSEFKDGVLYTYCYDTENSIKEINEIIYFSRTAQAYYDWELNGTRYKLNRLSYFFKSAYSTDQLIESDKLIIPKGRSEDGENNNHQLAIQNNQLWMFLNDIELTRVRVKDDSICFPSILYPLLILSKNNTIRYEQNLMKYSSDSSCWQEAYLKLGKEVLKEKLMVLPYFLSTKTDFVSLNKNSKVCSQKVSKEVADLFAYSANSQTKFDRFKIRYSVWLNPFIEINGFLFCPMLFLANNDWFYGSALAGLENLNQKNSSGLRKESSTQMEEKVGGVFRQKGWDVKVITDQQASKVDGDADVIVSNGNTTLLLQLKRTKFRLDLKEAYDESILSDRKACQQLNDAEIFFSKENEICLLEGDVHKWIVSTSFENTLSEIQGCLKVNYFDLLSAIENPDLKELDELINYIQEDSGMRAWLKILHDSEMPYEYKMGIIEAGLPLPLAMPKDYNQEIFIGRLCSVEYQKCFNKALELRGKNKIDRAINLLLKCADKNSNDYEVWSALANCYADKKNYKDAFKCFEKALEILPNDPWLMLNYAKAHRENGNLIKVNEISEDIQKEYWFITI